MQNPKPKRKLPTIIRWVLWVLLVQFILMNISAAFYANKLTYLEKELPKAEAKSPGNIFRKTWKLFTGPTLYRSPVTEMPVFPFDTVLLKTDNGTYLDAWYGKTDSTAKGTVLLFHGVTSNKSAVLAEANEFRYMGYNTLLVDFRAHGFSGGSRTSIGIKEAEDIKLAYDFISAKGEKKIFLWGISMGAVAIAKAIADYELKPAGVILEMPFGSLQQHLKGRARTLGFPAQPFGFLVTFWMGVERGYNGFKHRTARYAKKIQCPVLVQWGAEDSYVLRNEAELVYNAVTVADKKLVIYEGAGHESLAQRNTEQWRTEVGGFLQRNAR
jgi:uncharacterized protein